MTEPDNKQQTEQAKKLVSQIIKATGAAFMLAAPVIGLNLGGVAAAIGLKDASLQYTLGGVFLIVGLVDFFVMPKILGPK